MFVELQQFISFTLDRQATRLRAEWRADLTELRTELSQTIDAHHAATRTMLREILSRLDGPTGPGRS